MVFCFTKLLLDERHQLSKIWLAAHYEKKIKRSQIFEVDIVRSVQDILTAEIFYDLRISGHLLVGIVKIHSRKVKYLLTECNDIFYQVKIFRAGVIDLPDNLQIARKNDITLAEFFDDFQTVQNDLLDSIISSNQCNIEDITLKEINGNLTLLDENDMTNFVMHEEDGPITFDEDFLKDYENEMSVFDKNTNSRINKATEQKLNDVEPIVIDQEEFIQEALDNRSEMNEIPETEEHCVLNSQIVPDQADLCLVNGKIVHCQHENLDDLHEATNELYLEALVVKTPTAKTSKKRQPKKRKLCIDYIKSMSYEVIKKQMLDTSDVTSILELAPASKRLMILKEIGNAEQLFHLPVLKVINSNLLHLYKRNLKSLKNDNDLSFEEEPPEIPYKLQKSSKKEYNEEIVENQSVMLGKSDIEPISREMDSHLDTQNDLPAMDDIITETAQGSFSDDNILNKDELPVFKAPRYDEFFSINSDELQNTQFSKTSDERWEYALQGRIIQMLQHLKLSFGENTTVHFSAVVKNNRKFKVAQRFLCLLMLKKFQVISLEQSESFGEILISPEVNFDSACVNFVNQF